MQLNGTGTPGRIARWNADRTLGDSSVQDDGSHVSLPLMEAELIDAYVMNGTVTCFIDAANVLQIRAKRADGTILHGAVPLTAG